MKKTSCLLLFFLPFTIFAQDSWEEVPSSGINGITTTGIFAFGEIIFWANGENGLYKSVDNGENWVLSLDENISFMNGNSDFILAATSNGLYKSINEGASWSILSQEIFKTILNFKSKDEFDLYDGLDLLYRTENGGQNFSTIKLPEPPVGKDEFGEDICTLEDPYLVYKKGLYIYGFNEFITDCGGLYFSRDNGSSFELLTAPGKNNQENQIIINFGNLIHINNVHYRLEEKAPTGWHFSPDIGETWLRSGTVLGSLDNRAGFFSYNILDTVIYVSSQGVFQNEPSQLNGKWKKISEATSPASISSILYTAQTKAYLFYSGSNSPIYRLEKNLAEFNQESKPISPSNNSIAYVNRRTLKWNASPSANSYNIQVSEYPTFHSLLVNKTTTDTTYLITNLEQGTKYYWRVNALNTDTPSYFSSSFSFLVSDSLEAPYLLSPQENKTQTPLNLILSWKAVSFATSYNVQVFTSNDLINPVASENGLTTTTYQLDGLSPGTEYIWRAKGLNQTEESAWSLGTFTTTNELLDLVLQSPEQNQQLKDDTLSFQWNYTAIADSFELQISREMNMEDFVLDPFISTTDMVSISDLPINNTYFWRIGVYKDSELIGYSPVGTFSYIDNSDFISTLLYPVSGQTNVDLNSEFKWSSVPETDSYIFKLYRDDIVIFETNTGPDTSYFVNNLDFATSYSWDVTTVFSNEELISQKQFFSTSSFIEAPTLLLPNNNSEHISIDENVFSWTSSEFATYYEVELDLVKEFSNPVKLNPEDTLIVTDINLESNSKYYWRVKAVYDTTTTSEWSAIFSFITDGTPTIPILLSPEDKATYTDLLPEIRWSDVNNANSYALQVFSVGANGGYLVDSTGITDTTFVFESSVEAEEYFWRVKSESDTYEDSDWTTVRSFIFKISTGLEEFDELPKKFTIRQNYPNPFNPTTTIVFGVPELNHVQIEIFNMLGQKVFELLNETKQPGWHQVQFNAEHLTSGIYFYRINAGGYTELKKMVLLK